MSAKIVDIHAAQQRKDRAALVEHATPVSGDDVAELINPKSQDSVAMSFVREHPDIRYVADWEAGRTPHPWVLYDGTSWNLDRSHEIRDLMRRHARSKQLSVSSAFVTGALNLASSSTQYKAQPDTWDQDPWLLGTPGGVYDLRTGKKRKSAKGDYIMRRTSVQPDGDAPRWLRFIEQVTRGDAALAEFLQRLAGYALSGSTKEEALFFIYGPPGSGKSAFVAALRSVMGDYALPLPNQTLVVHRNEAHPTEVAVIDGYRLATADEIDVTKMWNTSLLDSITAGDEISSRKMNADFRPFKPVAKLLITGNNYPRFPTEEEGMKRRFNVIPFPRSFYQTADDDPDLKASLKNEAGGILKWAIDGAVKYSHTRSGDRLRRPAGINGATSEFFRSTDVFSLFLEACCDIGAGNKAMGSELFNAWVGFTRARNERSGRNTEFAGQLRKAGFKTKASREGTVWVGIALKIAVKKTMSQGYGSGFAF